MKKFSVMTAICAIGLMLFGACTKDDLQNKENTDNAKFLTFGFFMEDNQIIKEDAKPEDKPEYYIGADFVADLSNGKDQIIVRLPDGTDVTNLKARFTTLENVKVRVGSQLQESAVTANDFTAPVDYIVTDESANVSKRYTVSMVFGEDMSKEWKEVALYSEEGCKNDSYAMCLSPKDQTPQLLILRERKESDAEGAPTLTVGLTASFKDGALTTGKEITYLADNTNFKDARWPDIFCDNSGNVMVSYYNYSSSSDYDVFVRKADGSIIGEPFCKTKVDKYTLLEVDPETGHKICAVYANSDFGNIVRRGLNIAYNKTGAWEGENTIADFGTGQVHRANLFNDGKNIYLGGQFKGDQQSYFVYKYKNGSWEKVINALPEKMSGAAILLPSPIAVASDGTIYMLAGNDGLQNGSWFIQLMKLNAETKTWENVGSPIVDNSVNAPTNSRSEFSLALRNDQPVVCYLNQDNSSKRYPVIVSFDNEKQDWGESFKIADVNVKSGSLNLLFDKNGNGYVGFMEYEESRIFHLLKYENK